MTLQTLEVGFDHGAVTPYAESGPVELGSGDRVMHANKLVPDADTTADVRVTFSTRFYPSGAESTFGPYTLTENTDVRFTGRQVSMRVTGTNPTGWRWGKPRLEVNARGKR